MKVLIPIPLSRFFLSLLLAAMVLLTVGITFIVKGCTDHARRALTTSNANGLVASSNAGSEKAFDELKNLSESTHRFSHLTALAALRKVQGHDTERTKIAIQELLREDSVGWHEALLMLSEMRELNAECAPAIVFAVRNYTFGVYDATAIRALARIDGAICKHKLELLEIASIRKNEDLSNLISIAIAEANCQ